MYSLLYSFILSNEYVDTTGNKLSSADDLSPILTTLTYITDAKTSGMISSPLCLPFCFVISCHHILIKMVGPSDVKFRFLLLKIIRILSRKVFDYPFVPFPPLLIPLSPFSFPLFLQVENRVGLPPKCFKSLVQQLQHSNSKISSEGASSMFRRDRWREGVRVEGRDRRRDNGSLLTLNHSLVEYVL